MRWFSFFILAYITLGLQLGLSAHVQFHGSAPNLPLLAVIFISLNAPRDEAMLGSFLLGALQDLVTLEPMGLYAFAYGLIAIFVSSLGQLAYREHPLTQLFMTVLGGILTAILLLAHSWIYPRLGRQSIHLLIFSIFYTALLAPIILGVLQRMQGAFAFDTPRRKLR